MVESRMLWIEEDKENHAVVWRAVEQAGSISGLAVHAHEPKLCHGDSLCCLDCNKCKAAGAWAQSLGLADTRLPLLLLHNKVKGSRRNVWERERCLHAVRALSKWTPALVPSTEVNLWEHNSENKMPAWDGLHFWAEAGISGLCNGAFSALGSSFDAVMSCRDVHLLGELHPGRRHGCLCPGGFFFVLGAEEPSQASPAFACSCPSSAQTLAWVSRGELGSRGCSEPLQCLHSCSETDRNAFFFSHAESHQLSIHMTGVRAATFWFNLVLCPHYSSAGRWVVIC